MNVEQSGLVKLRESLCAALQSNAGSDAGKAIVLISRSVRCAWYFVICLAMREMSLIQSRWDASVDIE